MAETPGSTLQTTTHPDGTTTIRTKTGPGGVGTQKIVRRASQPAKPTNSPSPTDY
jgi:hypothetical protein